MWFVNLKKDQAQKFPSQCNSSDTSNEYQILKPISLFKDSSIDFDLSGNNVLFSNNSKHIFHCGEDGKEFIDRYTIVNEKLSDKKQHYIKSLVANCHYEISLFKCRYSENILAVCIPISQEEETKHWSYNPENYVDVIIFNNGLTEITRRKVRIKSTEFIDPENLPTTSLNQCYITKNDTIFIGENEGSVFRIISNSFEETQDLNKTSMLAIQDNDYQIVNSDMNSTKNKLKIFNLRLNKEYRYELKSEILKIHFFDSSFISIINSNSFEKYKLVD